MKRLVVVPVDASEKQAFDIIATKDRTSDDIELIFVDKLTETIDCLYRELRHKQGVSCICFIALHISSVPRAFPIIDRISKDPLTRRISRITIWCNEPENIPTMGYTNPSTVADRLKDMMVRLSGKPKPPS
jgi:hypothetical protein